MYTVHRCVCYPCVWWLAVRYLGWLLDIFIESISHFKRAYTALYQYISEECWTSKSRIGAKPGSHTLMVNVPATCTRLLRSRTHVAQLSSQYPIPTPQSPGPEPRPRPRPRPRPS